MPDQDKINNIRKLALGLDHPVSFSDPPRPVEVQKFLTSIAGEPYADLLSALVLRSMAKAEYLEKDEGHFGLASKQYCHFTAPIRRYSDSFTHRQIKSFLHKEKGQSRGEAAKVAEHVSVTERVAVDAERASVQQKAVEYYADRIGQVYQGEISGFSESSFFVRLPSGVEGSVFFRTLKAYFHYEPDRLSAVNRTSGTRLSIGQEVEVKLVAVDTNRRFIDLELTKACNLEVSGKGRRKKKLSSGGQSRKTGRRKKKASGHRKKDKPTRSGSKDKRKKARRSKGKGRKFS